MQVSRVWLMVLLLGVVAGLSACDGSSTGLEIAGAWSDDYGGQYQVDDEGITQIGFGDPSFYHVSQYSNDGRWLVARNDSANAYSADLWSRFDWTWFDAGQGESLYFCQIAYDAASEEAAMNAEAADPEDPTAGGCAGYAWSRLSPAGE